MHTSPPSAYLEHTNITVSNPDQIAKLLVALFDWEIRWSGASMDNGYTVHVGNENSYIALYTNPTVELACKSDHRHMLNLNHIAVVVDDLAAIEQRAKTLGLKPFNHADYEPGQRFYVMAENKLEIEVVSYAA